MIDGNFIILALKMGQEYKNLDMQYYEQVTSFMEKWNVVIKQTRPESVE